MKHLKVYEALEKMSTLDVSNVLITIVEEWESKLNIKHFEPEIPYNEIEFEIANITNENYKDFNEFFDLLLKLGLKFTLEHYQSVSVRTMLIIIDISSINEEEFKLLSNINKYNL